MSAAHDDGESLVEPSLTDGREVVPGDLELVAEDQLEPLGVLEQRRVIHSCDGHRKEGRHEVFRDMDWTAQREG